MALRPITQTERISIVEQSWHPGVRRLLEEYDELARTHKALVDLSGAPPDWETSLREQAPSSLGPESVIEGDPLPRGLTSDTPDVTE